MNGTVLNSQAQYTGLLLLRLIVMNDICGISMIVEW